MRRRLCFLCIFVAVSSCLWGQLVREYRGNAPPDSRQYQTLPHDRVVRGQVSHMDGRVATDIAVAVYLSGDRMHLYSALDSSGRFQFPQLGPGIYFVYVRAAGHRDMVQQVDITIARTGTVDFVLVPLSSPDSTGAAATRPDATAEDKLVPENARKNFDSARKVIAEGGKAEEAIELLKAAVSQYPNFTEAYLLMGAAYVSQQNWDEAVKAFSKAAELNPLSPSAYIALGAIDNQKNNFADAKKHLLEAVVIAPDSADAHFELGQAYFGLGQLDSAREHLAKASQIRPGDPAQHVVMGNVLLRLRDAEGALKEFQEALRLDPNGPMAAPTRQMIERIESALKQVAKGE